jgi:hypothetical protein
MRTFTLTSKELGGQFTSEYFYDGLGVNGGNIWSTLMLLICV